MFVFIHFSVRGALNSIWDPSCNLGALISFLLGIYLNCVDQARMQLIAPVLFIIAAFFLPESPEFWTIKNDDKVNCVMAGSVQPSYIC